MEVWNVWHRIDDDHLPEHVAQYDNEKEAEIHAIQLMDAVVGGYDDYAGYIWYEKYEEHDN